MGIRKLKSFTLIELIVSVGIVGLILPVVFNIFFTMVRQQLVLVSYQMMKQQGDSAQRNILNLLQNRAQYITDSGDTGVHICPIFPLPTPTFFPSLYIKDKNLNLITLRTETVPFGETTIDTIASDSGKTYSLTSTDVSVSDFEFSCYKVNEFTTDVVSVRYTIGKSTTFREMSLPYSFSVRLRNY